ncbi:MAG TPA: c-type cytochrome [Burkholderiaceae bacterium]|nr:c-type cytochrome [Burkholderiaceae bacterium]
MPQKTLGVEEKMAILQRRQVNKVGGEMLAKIVLALSFIGAATVSLTASAAGSNAALQRPDAAKGKQIAAQVCAACHNADGNSTVSTNPKLAGQSAEYLVKQLTDLAKPAGDKTGRESPVMSGFAASLSPADRQNVAAWFASQTATAGTAGGPDAAQLGERLYRAGLPAKAVPACAGCHGPSGNGLPALYPKVSGQYSDYVEAQLRAFRDGSRHNSEAMEQIAFRLSDPEIKALADFVAGLRAQ